MLDLNEPVLPANLENNFDFIINHGTLEHIFHVPNALENIGKMTKSNGKTMHNMPVSGSVNHGFYQFCPTLVFDYYEVNNWDIHYSAIASFQDTETSSPVYLTDWIPGISTDQYHPINNHLESFLCIVKKTPSSRNDVIPQQGYYMRLEHWQNPDPSHAQAGRQSIALLEQDPSSNIFWTIADLMFPRGSLRRKLAGKMRRFFTALN